MSFRLGIGRLTVLSALGAARGEIKCKLTTEAVERINQSAGFVAHMVTKGKTVYGVNTGFGALARTVIDASQVRQLQENILRSHSVGVGAPIPRDIAKLMLILKAHSLSLGFSGVSLSTINRLLWHIENDVIPVVPSQGSVGASGDLAPLAHLFLPLIGLGEVDYKGRRVRTETVLHEFDLKPLTLGPKEGLALINGTQFIAAYALVVLKKWLICLNVADIIGGLSLEAMKGSVKPFDARLHSLRPFAGAQLTAHRLRILLQGSQVLASHKDCDRVQDPYSLRCMPQVHGAVREAWRHLHDLTEIEINSVTDNPIILDEETALNGGNFHGEPLAIPLDYSTVAASELGNISERRTYLLLEGKEGLPPLLMRDVGINSGFMIPQYTAAALVSENKSLCFPASADSIPTSLGQEDHVSMGAISARKALQVIENVEKILAIELLCASQAFDFRRPLRSSVILEACHDLVRANISHAQADRVFAEDVEKARELIASGELVAIAENMAEKNKIKLVEKEHDSFFFS